MDRRGMLAWSLLELDHSLLGAGQLLAETRRLIRFRLQLVQPLLEARRFSGLRLQLLLKARRFSGLRMQLRLRLEPAILRYRYGNGPPIELGRLLRGRELEREKRPQPGIGIAHVCRRPAAPAGRTQRAHWVGKRAPDREHPEAMAVQELEARILGPQLLPKLRDAEITLAHIGVVHENDTAVRELGPPALEIVSHVAIVMPAVQVQEIDRAVAEVRQRLVEGRPNQRRERSVAGVVMSADLPIDVLVVKSGMIVALPGIDRVASRFGFETLHCLTKREIGTSSMGAKLDQHARTQRSDQPECERHVLQPGRLRAQLLRRPEAGRRNEATQISITLDRSPGVAPAFTTRSHACLSPSHAALWR